MSVKSIIDIDVNSASFQKFHALFDKYQKALAKMPSMWGAVGKEQKGLAAGFERMTAAMMAQAQLSRKAGEVYKAQNLHLMQGERLWNSMAKSTKSVASNIAGATRSLLHWTKIFGEVGGLLGAGGLWGIDRMAANVAGQRRSAMGLGMSIGGEKAFATYFERLVDPGSFLGRLSEMEGNPAEAWPLAVLGVTPTGKTDKDAVSLLKAMRARALGTPANQLGMLDQQTGMDVGTQTWRRIHDSTRAEFAQMLRQVQANQSQMNVPNALAWQNLSTAFAGNWGKVTSAFETRLGTLAPQLSGLSDSFTKLATTLINSPAVERGLATFATWLDRFNKVVGAPDFAGKVEQFANTFGKGVSQFVNGIERTADAIQRIGAFLQNPLGHDSGPVTASKGRFLDQLSTLETNSNLPKGMLAYQFQKESGGLLNPPDSAKGAVGAFQFKPETAAWLNKLHHTHLDPRKPGEAAVLADYYDEWAMQHYGGNVSKALASYNMGSGRLDALLRQHPKDWQRYIPSETQRYLNGVDGNGRISLNGLNINVSVSAPPGSNVHTTMNAMAQ